MSVSVFIPPEAGREAVVASYSETGVDLTLIRWMLSKTPEERLEYLQAHANGLWELRQALADN